MRTRYGWRERAGRRGRRRTRPRGFEPLTFGSVDRGSEAWIWLYRAKSCPTGRQKVARKSIPRPSGAATSCRHARSQPRAGASSARGQTTACRPERASDAEARRRSLAARKEERAATARDDRRSARVHGRHSSRCQPPNYRCHPKGAARRATDAADSPRCRVACRMIACLLAISLLDVRHGARERGGSSARSRALRTPPRGARPPRSGSGPG